MNQNNIAVENIKSSAGKENKPNLSINIPKDSDRQCTSTNSTKISYTPSPGKTDLKNFDDIKNKIFDCFESLLYSQESDDQEDASEQDKKDELDKNNFEITNSENRKKIYKTPCTPSPVKFKSKELPIYSKGIMDCFEFFIKSDDKKEVEKSKTELERKKRRLYTTKTLTPTLKSPILDENDDSFIKKMSHFIDNYDDLLNIVNNNSNFCKTIVKSTQNKSSSSMMVSSSINKKMQSTKDFKRLQNSTEKSEKNCITDFITSAQKKKKIDEEERCVIMKSLTNSEEIEDFYVETEECLKRIAKITVPPISEIESLMIDLPFEDEFRKGKRLAVFDLDETLIHSEIKKPEKGEFLIQVKIPNGVSTKVNLLIFIPSGWS